VTESSLLRAASLTKTVSTADHSLTIVNDVSLSVAKGETVAIVGASGSGKTTLLGLLAGLDRPTSGEIFWGNEALSSKNEDQLAAGRAQRIGFIFQSFQLLPALTALENVALPLELAGARDAEARASEWLGKVGLGGRVNHMPRQLSGGEQQRVAIARAFVTSPELVFADEPTGNLDSKTGADVVNLMFALNAQAGTTLVLVTHDLQLAARCARTIKLADGRVC
jgi:putative ABC transport system ATP-binding protein